MESNESCQNTGQTVYIYGATGAGKTTFVVDFLSKKQYQYLSISDVDAVHLADMAPRETNTAHEKSYMKEIIVIDDLYLLETQEDRTTCERLIEELSGRKDIWLILISRAPISKWLNPVSIRHIFVIIKEKMLFLTEKEQQHYLESWEMSLTQTAYQRIHKLSSGYPLSLRIAAMRFKEIPKEQAGNRTDAELNAIEKARMDLWDYLETYVYDQWSVELQEFLETICIVEQFDLSMAQQIFCIWILVYLTEELKRRGRLRSVSSCRKRQDIPVAFCSDNRQTAWFIQSWCEILQSGNL